MQAQRQPPVIGQEAMIGDKAVVLCSGMRKTKIRYRSEIWHGISTRKLHCGQQVVITNVKGLPIWVKPKIFDRRWEMEPASNPMRQRKLQKVRIVHT